MREEDWKTAHAMAHDLVQRDCDPNEVQKAFVYVRTHQDGERFFRFLDTLVRHGQFLVRSRRTLDYYRAILEVCRRHLTPYRADAEIMSRILGWSVRLMRYYIAQQAQARPERPPTGRERRGSRRRRR